MTGPGLLLALTVWSTTADPLPAVEEVRAATAEASRNAPESAGRTRVAAGGRRRQTLRKLLAERGTQRSRRGGD